VNFTTHLARSAAAFTMLTAGCGGDKVDLGTSGTSVDSTGQCPTARCLDETSTTPTTGATATSGPTVTSTVHTDGTSTTDTTGTGDTTGEPDTTGTTGVDTDGFDPAGVFGDGEFGVQEMDLVGTWGLHWDPAQSPWNSELTIEADGSFVWRETTDSCMSETLATGTLWVEGYQIVMHVDVWERQLPFATLDALGEEFLPPFRLRLGYSLQGLYLGLAAPERITSPEPYAGRTWVRYFADDDWLAGQWQLEAELTAIPGGSQSAIVIVREVYQALLDPAFNDVPVEGTGETVRSRTFWAADPPKTDKTLIGSGDYLCVGACDQPAGAATIDGEFFVYGSYGGAQRLMSFASGLAFQRDTPPACP
jgi:hypothetical protein